VCNECSPTLWPELEADLLRTLQPHQGVCVFWYVGAFTCPPWSCIQSADSQLGKHVTGRLAVGSSGKARQGKARQGLFRQVQPRKCSRSGLLLLAVVWVMFKAGSPKASSLSTQADLRSPAQLRSRVRVHSSPGEHRALLSPP
jgi:hypothetical protein